MSTRLLDPEIWAEVEPYLDCALELEPAAREEWLTELATTRPDTARAVRDLLHEREALNSAGFLDAPLLFADDSVVPEIRAALAQFSTQGGDEQSLHPLKAASRELLALERERIERLQTFDLAPDKIVGPYRLIREIGCGGMSSVWLAQQSDGGIKREIALKLPLVHQRFHVERFMRERDILAALTHSNIARLYDAGVTESGQPYLAMEYVAGTAITAACDTRCITIRERLRLFMQVLEAVQFAHAQLIIHRDLKPSNILVTPEGRVVVVDFGIGKLLTGGVEETDLTQVNGRPLTPRYASPEQILGESLSTASDIYSLGVILYELLTGASPYRPKHTSRAALEDAVLAGDLHAPSRGALSAQSAAARGSTTRSLVRSLAGDVDTIVLKALKRDPARRYAAASAFAQDLHNYLHSLPVSARPDSSWYRAACFVSRYKGLVIAATSAAVVMLSFLAVALWQASAASAERDRSHALALRNKGVTEFFETIIRDAAAATTPVTVPQLLAQSEHLALAAPSRDPETQAAVLEIIALHYGNLDEHEHARTLLEMASTALQHSPDHELRSCVACRLAVKNYLLGNTDESLRALETEGYQHNGDPEVAAGCLSDLASLTLQMNPRRAMRHASHGLALLQSHHVDAAGLEGSLLGHLAFGDYLVGDLQQAELHFAQALEKYRQIGRERSADTFTVRRDWATAMLGAGLPRRALQMYDEIEQIRRERGAGTEPDTSAAGNRAVALMQLGRYQEAQAASELGCRLAQRRKDPYGELHCAVRFAELKMEVHALDDAAEYLRRAHALHSSTPSDSQQHLATAILDAKLELARGNVAQARTLLERFPPSDASPAINLHLLRVKAEIELAGANLLLAAEYAQRAVETAASMHAGAPHSKQDGLALLVLGRTMQRLAQPAKARTALQAAITNLENTVDANHPALVAARRSLDEIPAIEGDAG